MYWSCALAFLVILRCSTAVPTIRGSAKLDPHEWVISDGTEAFKMTITIKMQYSVPNGWRMALIFSQPIKKVEVWRAEVMNETSADKTTYALMNKNFNPRLTKGEVLTMTVVVYKVNKGSIVYVIVLFKGGPDIPTLPTLPPPTTLPSQIAIHPLKPIDESDSGFKMILQYQVSDAVKYWSISLKFTKEISTRNFNIDKAKVAIQKGPTSESFCFGPQNYNRNLKANSVLRLEFTCRKAELYEAAPNAFFVFHPNSAKCEDFDIPRSTPGPAAPPDSAVAEMIHQWEDNFKMKVNIQVINSVRGGWKITLEFSEAVAEISNLNAAKFAGNSKDKRTYYMENFPGQIQNANLKQCAKIRIEFAGKLVSSAAVPNKPLTAKVLFERKEPEYVEVNPHRACPTVSHQGSMV